MSIADELAKLNELRKEGVLSDAEFEQKKAGLLASSTATRPKKKRNWPMRIASALLLLVLAIFVVPYIFRSGQMPKCDSTYATDLLKSAVEQSPMGRADGISVVTLNNISEVSWDETAQVRRCQATAGLNNARSAKVTYKLSWHEKKGGRVLIEFRFP